MKLLYTLSDSQRAALGLKPGEEPQYCVPTDLDYDGGKMRVREQYADKIWLVVTQERFLVLEDEKVSASFLLDDCEKIKCEHQVHSGIVIVVKKDGLSVCAARFSMRHIVRAAYAVRGAQAILTARRKGETPERIVSLEYEKYCEKCGRALPGTRKCPYCEGKADILKKFMSLCGEYVGKLLLISLIMVLITIVDLVTPLIQRQFIDGVLGTGNGSWRALWIFVGVTFSMLVARILLEVYRFWHCMALGTSLSMSMRRSLYYKIQTLSLSFINNRKPGELLNRVSQDTNQIRRFMEEVFGEMFSTLLTMTVSLVVMFMISWKMTLFSLVFVVVVFVVTKAFWHHIRSIFHRQWLKADDLASNLQDIISGMRVVKSFGKEEKEAARFQKKTEEFAAINKKNEIFWAVFFPIVTFLMGAGSYIAVYFGGMDVLNDRMTLGELVQFITYCGYLFGPLSWMTHMPRMVMQMITSLNRIYDVLDEEPVIADSDDSREFPVKGAFTFENVSFGYHTYEPVLENISFQVNPGEMIGLVGASGTGKSTLINLIMRLYDVDQGRITIDGVDIRKVKTESLHSQIGVVLQETFLFSGSILANIRFARQDASLAEVIQAAKAANAHDFICKTPDGYNTYVGEHGYNLSGGERQRIAIARAILNNPRLLILDEATSALDTESEFLIQQALDRLVKGRTTFAIAHRLSTLRNADRLVVIDRHGVAEIGTHNELLEKKGIYYGLVTAQLQMAEGK
ncbi:ABC transporter ATP-binding protein [Acetatifactor muris]|uniref:ABC transporter ATP-binding protein n=1 Tax=Acetatifactor muris TaxID=879566 RepID=UPI0023F14474|nr:ABC transporter ATP-binding protein [Acetatifactor muris]MCI8799292.1 ABC transporter ATP-binding protein [Lachnospiraceae bacterium]